MRFETGEQKFVREFSRKITKSQIFFEWILKKIQKCFFEKALPVEVFKYFSNVIAVFTSFRRGSLRWHEDWWGFTRTD
ncbi:hypothetical protein HN954_02310 [bacterium]|jgi:hypothetical protein|nr:hypothetical protein [bacterium]MBT6831557.1 hypothetical protein [bacterium]MBT6996238.1 hypothetical protein [bacterium]MBT7772279.1 hypothetical protein [bacterium]